MTEPVSPPLARAATRAEFEQRQRDRVTLTTWPAFESSVASEKLRTLRDRDYPELLPPELREGVSHG